MKERNYGLDLMRVFLCICVITLHSFNWFGAQDYTISIYLPVILIAADGLFYMLSGYFNLNKEFKDSSDIKKFYKNKFIYLLFPFLAFNFAWTLWDYIHITSNFNLFELLGIYYELIVNSGADGHMWFMYPLFGLILSTPFLSKMLHNMDDKELKILWRIAIGFNFFVYYLCEDFEMHMRLLCWVLDGWVIYYFAGYYYRRVLSKEKPIKWIIIGLVGFVVTMLGTFGDLPFLKRFAGANDIQPMFTLFCIGYLCLWDKTIKITNKVAAKVIKFLSSNTFLIYLYHMRGIEYILRKANVTEPSFVSGLTVVAGTFAFSLIAAFVTNSCLKPVQKLMDKFIKVK